MGVQRAALIFHKLLICMNKFSIIVGMMCNWYVCAWLRGGFGAKVGVFLGGFLDCRGEQGFWIAVEC